MATTTRTHDAGVAENVTRGAHIADPPRLGLAAFALTTFVLSFVNTGLFTARRAGGLRPGAGLRRRRPSSPRHVGVRQGQHVRRHRLHVVRRLLDLLLVADRATDVRPRGPTPAKGIGLYLLAWGIFTAYMTVAATRVSGAVLAVFALLTPPSWCWPGASSPRPTRSTTSAAGSASLTALAAWYASFAGVTAFTFKRPIVPTATR